MAAANVQAGADRYCRLTASIAHVPEALNVTSIAMAAPARTVSKPKQRGSTWKNAGVGGR